MAPASIRLDRNELPFTPDLPLLGALSEVLQQANRYPAGEWQARLAGLIAARTGCRAEEVLLGAGSSQVLDFIWRATVSPGAKVVYAAPGFEMYPIYTRQRGGVPVEVPLTDDFAPDLDRIARVEHAALVALINPYAPSGVRVDSAAIAELVDRVPADTVIVLDEAYQEFDEFADPRASVALAVARPNVVVTRTFSKAYGLAGLRIGYAIANPELLARIAACSMPFTVTDLACAAAAHRLADTERHADRMTDIRAERDRLTVELRATGIEVVASATNFVLLPGRPDLAAHLRGLGLAVSTSSIGTRVSVGTRAENDVLLSAIREQAHQPV